jgi:hypothetical protein
MIQFADYVDVIHQDRRRTFEAAAGRAAIQKTARSVRRSRRFPRRPRFRVSRAHLSGGFG